jgi:hypothetical protein
MLGPGTLHGLEADHAESRPAIPEGHRDALAKLISDIGATPIAPKSDDDYVSELKLGALKSQADIRVTSSRSGHVRPRRKLR